MLEGGRVEEGTEEWIVDSERGKIDGKTKEGAKKKNQSPRGERGRREGERRR